MHFYFCQIEHAKKAENDCIYHDDFCEKIMYDFSVENKVDLGKDRISIWPSELAPLWVRNGAASSCATDTGLDKWLFCFRRFESDALQDPIGYYQENPDYAFSFLELALKHVEAQLDDLWKKYENEYHVALDVATRSDEGAASEQALNAEEFMKYAEETKKSIDATEILREQLKNEISALESLPEDEKHVPREIWESLEIQGEKPKFVPELPPAENVARQDDNDGAAGSVVPVKKTKEKQTKQRRKRFPAMKVIVRHMRDFPTEGRKQWMTAAEVANELKRSAGTLRNDRFLKDEQDDELWRKQYRVTRDKFGRLYYIDKKNKAYYYDETINPDGDDFENFYKRVDGG